MSDISSKTAPRSRFSVREICYSGLFAAVIAIMAQMCIRDSTYMVFAEQRLLAMCAEKKHAHATALSDLPALFGGAQNGYFTHIWGFKQQMRENPKLYEMCIRDR